MKKENKKQKSNQYIKLREYFPSKNLPKVIGLIMVIFLFALSLTSIPYLYFQTGDEMQSVKIEKKEDPNKMVLSSVIYNLVGTVQSVDEDSFILEASVYHAGEKGQITQTKEERKVNITPDTRISRLTFIPKQGSDEIKQPSETLMSFEDIEVGDYMEVISDQDISVAQEFEAIRARFLPANF